MGEPTKRPSQNPTTSEPTKRPTPTHDDCPDRGMDVIGQHCSFHHRCEYDYVECCGENEPSIICKCEHHTVQCIAYDRCMTACPTPQPTMKPSHNPTTAEPTKRPSHNPTTAEPTKRPSHNPTTADPTRRPTSGTYLTPEPSRTYLTPEPTKRPTEKPTEDQSG